MTLHRQGTAGNCRELQGTAPRISQQMIDVAESHTGLAKSSADLLGVRIDHQIPTLK